MHRTLAHRLSLGAALSLCLGATSVYGTTIDTIAGWNGVERTAGFGEGNTPTYGQTVTVPADNVLDSFTFVLRQEAPDPTHFHAYVMAWNDGASRATGPVLFAAGPSTVIGDIFYHSYTIPTGGLPLIAGNQYVLFFTTLNDSDGINDGASWASRNTFDAYAGGLFVFNNGGSFAGLSTTPWSRDWQGPGYDLTFSAVFSAVPEPSTAALAAGLLTASALWVRRRRKSAALLPGES